MEFQTHPPLEIVFQDDYFVAVNKPAGLLVHRAKQTPKDEPVLLQMLRDQIGKFLFPAHRIDRPTSGIVLFGLTSDAAARLVDLFTKRQVAKTYRAIVRGYTRSQGIIEIPLRDRFGDDQPDYDPLCHPEQEAITEYRTLQWYELPWPQRNFLTCRYALVEAHPKTGRWHQIRRHLRHIAHPIIGDYRHGDPWHNLKFEEEFGVNRMLLAAYKLELIHPISKVPLAIEANMGSHFESALAHLEAFRVPYDAMQIPEDRFEPEDGNVIPES